MKEEGHAKNSMSSKTAQKLVREREKKMGWSQAYQLTMAEALPEYYKAWGKVYETLLKKEGALPPKYRTLIYLALSCARGARGTKTHIAQAVGEGASRQEIIETIALTTLCFGGMSVRHGIDALDELETERGRLKV